MKKFNVYHNSYIDDYYITVKINDDSSIVYTLYSNDYKQKLLKLIVNGNNGIKFKYFKNIKGKVCYCDIEYKRVVLQLFIDTYNNSHYEKNIIYKELDHIQL